MSSSKVCILLLTYNRFNYAAETLVSTLQNVKSSRELLVHIADDGSPEGYVDGLLDIARRYVEGFQLSVSTSNRGGYGANYNRATQVVHNLPDVGYVLALEDDWQLRRLLDLDSLCSVLDVDDRIGCIRLGYIGYTQALRGEFVSVGGNHYLLFDPDSPEPHVFAGHPRLETIAWERRVGPWPEGVEPGQTEFEVCHYRESREGVAWPISLITPSGDMFAHIGAESANSLLDKTNAA